MGGDWRDGPRQRRPRTCPAVRRAGTAAGLGRAHGLQRRVRPRGRGRRPDGPAAAVGSGGGGAGSGALARAGLDPGDRRVAPGAAISRGRAHGPTVSSLHDLPHGSRHQGTRCLDALCSVPPAPWPRPAGPSRRTGSAPAARRRGRVAAPGPIGRRPPDRATIGADGFPARGPVPAGPPPPRLVRPPAPPEGAAGRTVAARGSRGTDASTVAAGCPSRSVPPSRRPSRRSASAILWVASGAVGPVRRRRRSSGFGGFVNTIGAVVGERATDRGAADERRADDRRARRAVHERRHRRRHRQRAGGRHRQARVLDPAVGHRRRGRPGRGGRAARRPDGRPAHAERRAREGAQRLPGLDGRPGRRERAVARWRRGRSTRRSPSSPSSRPRTARRPARTRSPSRARRRPAAPSGSERRRTAPSPPSRRARTGCSRRRIAIAGGRQHRSRSRRPIRPATRTRGRSRSARARAGRPPALTGVGLPVPGVEAAQADHADRDGHGPGRQAAVRARPPCSRSASRASRRSSRARSRPTANGVARFATTIPKGAMAGAGLATVLISTDEFGNLTDRQVLTVRQVRALVARVGSTRRSTQSRDRLDSGPRRSYDRAHAGLALPALRDPAGGERPAAGCAGDPPPPARRACISGAGSRAASGCAAWTPAARPSTAPRSAPAGCRRARPRRTRRRSPCRYASWCWRAARTSPGERHGPSSPSTSWSRATSPTRLPAGTAAGPAPAEPQAPANGWSLWGDPEGGAPVRGR